jgi:acetoacetyl-CoA synthetase
MRKPLWTPSLARKEQANVSRFISFVNEEHGLDIRSYKQLYQWSIDQMQDFWAAVWNFVDIKASKTYDAVVDDLAKFPGAKWFTGSRLNFAENLLRHRDKKQAFLFHGESFKSSQTTYEALYGSVARLAKAMRELGIVAGDRVVAYMPNLQETAVAMLATASIGAIWSSCGTELGSRAVLDRFGQIEPRLLFTVDGYYYKARTFDTLAKAGQVSGGIPSIQRTVVVPYIEESPDIASIPNAELFDDFSSHENRGDLPFEHLPFDHPVYIMFSSGTTGRPKCMVQGAGGILINHLKELVLHTDLRREDRITYITTPSWMMWNWLISSLAVGASIALYEGNPNHPDWKTMWQLIQEDRITIFGCSASYINYLRSIGAKPGEAFDLSSLREISQTGSPLSAEGFKYIYEEIKEDLHFNSIAGGTDINGCFACGTPIQPVYAGELQSPALGMKIKAYDEHGNTVVDSQAELVCEAPAPSMPLYFWNDSEGRKYRDAYFGVYPNVWRHGDWILVHGDTGGITFLGRSDFTLKPSGVRIGPSEIYNVVERFEEVADSMVVGQEWRGDQRIILFVKLKPEIQMSEALQSKIKRALRQEASPRHVPALILQAPDIPYTFNMKKVESAVSNMLNGRPVTNRDALTNPELLEFYQEVANRFRE